MNTSVTSIKLVLLGEAAVGKSSIVLRFVSNDFAENKEPTIGAAFLTQRVTIMNILLSLKYGTLLGKRDLHL